MTIQRMEHVGVVVDDLEAAVAFFVELGMEIEGRTSVEGQWVDRIIGLEGVRNDLAILRTPDGQGKLELVQFHTPTATSAEPNAASNVPGIRHILFAVDDLDDVLRRLYPLGAELVGEVEQYKDIYRLCYLRGPQGIIIELAEKLG